MISFSQIAAIAKYERKTLLRSWFFRIFALLALVFIGFWNVVLLLLDGGMGTWFVRTLPANVPYVSMLFLNVVQAVVAIFLASDFLKQDRKLDTTDVIYVRSMSNIDYVLGKTWGNVGVFLLLNLLVLGEVLIMNVLSPHVSLNVLAYLQYFLLISIPTLIFIMGLSFLLMSLLKNQAVTFLIMLGYVALALFYLKSKFYYIFDYMAYSIPMTYSDFVGFGNAAVLLNHRGMYLFFGLSFISFTIMMLTRLSHSKAERWVSGVLGSLFLVAALFMGYSHLERVQKTTNLRAELLAHHDELKDVAKVDVRSYDLEVKHQKDKIAVRAKLEVQNRLRNANDSLLFSLNPGLKVDSVLVNGKAVAFEQSLSTVLIKDYELKSWGKASIDFIYQGGIVESAAYLDIDKEEFEELNTAFLFQIDKRYAFLTENYVLLTRENMWYPVAGVGFGEQHLTWLNPQFSDFKLSVETTPNLTAISQGVGEQDEEGVWRFESSHANAQISLTIGEYQRITKEIDGLEFNIYMKPSHDYYGDFFETVEDTLSSVIAEALQDYERSLDLYYPFERFSLVEVPIQYYSYERVLGGAMEYAQPEMIFFGEKAALSEQADFNESYRRQKDGGGGPGGGWGRRNNQMTDEEIRIQVFRNFVSSFTSSTGRPDFSRSGGQTSVTETKNPYYAFPLFYYHAYSVSSDKWPVSNKVFGAYKGSAAEDAGMGGWMRDMNGMTGDEKANVALISYSFEELLQDPDQKEIINDVIELKGTSLLSIIREKTGDETFDNFLFDYLYRNRFKTGTLESFARDLEREFHLDLIDYMQEWFRSTELPSYLIGGVEAVNVLDGDELKTMVTFSISNIEDTEGVVELQFRTGGGPRMMGGSSSSDNITKLVHLDGNQTKEINMLLSGSPRGGTINTLTSKNIPSSIRMDWGRLEEDDKKIPFEGERILDKPVEMIAAGEIVVDNEDEGFEITTLTQGSRLRNWLLATEDEEMKYSSFNQWRPPLGWTLATNSDFYGTSIRSAYYAAAGNGDQIAKWHVPLQGEGFYSVYVYLYRPWGRGRDRTEYNYTLHHADGEEKIPVEVRDKGWYYLGAYYFKEDMTTVEMSNLSSGRMVVADAVKFVKQ